MYKFALRLLAFGSFVAWCVSANRAHHYDPDDWDDDDFDDDLHTEGFDARSSR